MSEWPSSSSSKIKKPSWNSRQAALLESTHLINFILAFTNILLIIYKNHPSILTVIPTIITEYLCNMVKCCRYCNFPELSVEASQHRCPICGIQFHGICSDFIHPEVQEEFDRCFDLIFSYNPDILPYRLESDRLGRIKRIIISEAQSLETLTEVTQKLWLWLCT